MDGYANLFRLSGFAKAEHNHLHLPHLTNAQKQREVEQTSSVVVVLAVLVCMQVCQEEKVEKMTV